MQDEPRTLEQDATINAEETAEEILVEEVSIDGMCGVY
ncbi:MULTISPECIES: mycofactocin precursor MftA [unclassified Streptomyces]|jgi:mycofactocin precursor